MPGGFAPAGEAVTLAMRECRPTGGLCGVGGGDGNDGRPQLGSRDVTPKAAAPATGRP